MFVTYTKIIATWVNNLKNFYVLHLSHRLVIAVSNCRVVELSSCRVVQCDVVGLSIVEMTTSCWLQQLFSTCVGAVAHETGALSTNVYHVGNE